MTKKEELIAGILKSELKSIKKLRKEKYQEQKEIRENGFDKEIHKSYHEEIKTGLSHTIGYCEAIVSLTEKVLYLLSQSDAKDIEAIIEKDKEISRQNKAEINRVFKEIRDNIKNREKNKKPKK